MYWSSFDLISWEAPGLVCHQSVLHYQPFFWYSPLEEGGWRHRCLLALGIVEVTDSPDPSVHLPFVVNSSMNSCWERLGFECSFRGVTTVKLNYEAETIGSTKGEFFLKDLLFAPFSAPKCRYSWSSFLQGQESECLVRFLPAPWLLYWPNLALCNSSPLMMLC